VASAKIRSAEFSLGRHPDNDLHITDGRLSGFHCQIERSMNAESGAMEVALRDLSTNGTFKNGQIVSLICFLVGNLIDCPSASDR